MNISATFIARPIATILVMLAILVGGSIGYCLLPVAAMPEVEFPTIAVSANLPGADPETMAASVAQPLERHFAAIPGVNQMTSSSVLGYTTVTLRFDLARNIDGAAGDVQSAINAAQGNLPKNLPAPPTYHKVNPADRPILVFGLTSKVMPLTDVNRYADLDIARRISMLPGVGQVSLYGEQKFAPTIQVNPASLASRGIGLEEVAKAVADSSAQLPVGTLQGPHQALQVATKNGQLFDAKSLERVVVAYRNGAPVRLQDVASVAIGSENPLQRAWIGTEEGIVICVWRQPGANIIDVVDQVKASLPELLNNTPPSVMFSTLVDRTTSIRESF